MKLICLTNFTIVAKHVRMIKLEDNKVRIFLGEETGVAIPYDTEEEAIKSFDEITKWLSDMPTDDLVWKD